MSALFSPPVLAKGRRLVTDRRVTAVTADTWRVRGDHGSYVVVTDGKQVATCTCPATVPGCAHLAAVLLCLRDGVAVPVETPDVPGDPFAGLGEAS
jgi:uncharacterized Zn finger protein